MGRTAVAAPHAAPATGQLCVSTLASGVPGRLKLPACLSD
jgi:hypothetical protein